MKSTIEKKLRAKYGNGCRQFGAFSFIYTDILKNK
jgi:hypothetical protein